MGQLGLPRKVVWTSARMWPLMLYGRSVVAMVIKDTRAALKWITMLDVHTGAIKLPCVLITHHLLIKQLGLEQPCRAREVVWISHARNVVQGMPANTTAHVLREKHRCKSWNWLIEENCAAHVLKSMASWLGLNCQGTNIAILFKKSRITHSEPLSVLCCPRRGCLDGPVKDSNALVTSLVESSCCPIALPTSPQTVWVWWGSIS